MTEDLSKALAERVAYLDQQLEQAIARALAAEQELHEARKAIAHPMRLVRLFHVKDGDRPMWVVAGDWNEALHAWRQVIVQENDGALSDEEQPWGIDFVCDSNDLLLSPGQIDQVVR